MPYFVLHIDQRAFDDVSGLKLGAHGLGSRDMRVLARMGASVIEIPAPEYYASLQTGVLDGIVVGNRADLDAVAALLGDAPYYAPVGDTGLLGDFLPVGSGSETMTGTDGPDDLTLPAGITTYFAGDGDDNIRANDAGNTIYGQNGDDILTIGAGADLLDGGWGFDTVRLGDGGATVDLDNSAANTGAARGDTFVSIEALEGGAGKDRLFGTQGAGEYLAGAGGDDLLVGRRGPDTLRGGDGDDLLIAGDVTQAADTTAGQVLRLYQATLDRLPDSGGLQHWSGRLDSGQITLNQAVDGFTGSREFQNTYGALDDAEFLELLYQNVLGRQPDAVGLADWTARIEGGMTRAQVVLGFSESPEFKAATNPMVSAWVQADDGPWWQAESVYRYYQATLDRAPNFEGLTYWMDRLDGGSTALSVVAGFTGSLEFQRKYGSLDDTEFVTVLYENVLDRAPDAGGLADWTRRMEDGMSRDNVVMNFANSMEFQKSSAVPFLNYMRAQQGAELEGGAGDDVLAGTLKSDTFVFNATDPGKDIVLHLDPWDVLSLQGFGYADAAEARAHLRLQAEHTVFVDGDVSIIFPDMWDGLWDDVMVLV